MPEELSNMDKLFELSTRIDERIRAVQEKQHEFDDDLAELMRNHNENMRKIAILESKEAGCPIHQVDQQIMKIDQLLVNLDKRIGFVEESTNRTNDRWKQILTFVIQLVWVLLASWLLVKLNLQSPAVP